MDWFYMICNKCGVLIDHYVTTIDIKKYMEDEYGQVYNLQVRNICVNCTKKLDNWFSNNYGESV